MSLVIVEKANFKEDYIDFDVIHSLTNVMPPAAVKALLEDVEGDIRLRLDRLDEINVTQASLDVIFRDAHDLKSIGGNFGLNELSSHAGTIERAARDGCTDTVRDHLPVLAAIGQKSLHALMSCAECGSGDAT